MIKNFVSTIEWLKHKNSFYKNMERFYRDELISKNDVEPIYECEKQIEEEFAKHANSKYCVLISCGTKAIELALKSFDIKDGDEVITTPLTFIATVNAIRLVGAKPVFVDVKKDTWNIDENKIAEKITDKTKAIIPVDIFGNPCNYDKILEIAKKYNLRVINDCCQSFLSKYNNKNIGGFGDISCFSTGGTKPFCGIGEGGFITANNKEVYEKIKSYINYNYIYNNKYGTNGTNGEMEYLEIVYLYSKLNELDNILSWKNEIADIYKQMKGIIWQKQEPNAISVWCYMQGVFESNNNRNCAKKIFQLGDIYNKTICDNDLYIKYQKEVPIARKIACNSMSFPIYPYMNKDVLIKAIQEYNSLL